jgi:hypothetical protein
MSCQHLKQAGVQTVPEPVGTNWLVLTGAEELPEEGGGVELPGYGSLELLRWRPGQKE